MFEFIVDEDAKTVQIKTDRMKTCKAAIRIASYAIKTDGFDGPDTIRRPYASDGTGGTTYHAVIHCRSDSDAKALGRVLSDVAVFA